MRLAELVDGDKSQLSRTLKTLDERGYVERDPDTLAYRLGWRVFGLAASAADARLLNAARPILRELVQAFEESVHLSVRQGDMVLTILSESPAATLHAPGRAGGLTPLGTTSAGRVLVADLAPDELDRSVSPSHGRQSQPLRSRDLRSCERSSSRGSSLPPPRSGA